MLRIEPLDTLFFRDARPFGPMAQGSSGLPQPQTVAGALRTAMLRRAGVDFERFAESIRSGRSFAEAVSTTSAGISLGSARFRGPWFALGGETMFPAPTTLRRIENDAGNGGIVRLDPLADELPGWHPPAEGMLPLWRRGRERIERVRGYIGASAMQKFLEGHTPDEIVKGEELFGFDSRTGISVASDRGTASEGLIYGVNMLALRPGVSLRMEISAPTEVLDLFPPNGMAVPLGGEGRRAVVTPEEAPDELRARDHGDGWCAVLTTPGLFGGWKPPVRQLTSAAVDGHTPVSGWDLARGGPKPNRFAVPAGSVYFFAPGEEPAARSFGDPADTDVGWGAFLQGVWTHA